MTTSTSFAAAPPVTPPRTPVGVRLPVPDEWAYAIAGFLQDREAAGRPATSRRSYKSALEHLARRTDVGPFLQSKVTLRAYIAAHHDWSTETRRSRRSTLIAFYDWAVGDELMTFNPARQLPKVKPADPRPRPAPTDVYQAALMAADPREKLMLRLSHEMGMRRDEVSRVNTADLWQDFDGEYVLNVHGKGSKTREMPCPDDLARQIMELPPGFVFPGQRAGHLSAEYVGRRVARLMPGTYHMHNLRHSYATRLYAESGDLLVVQEAMGHENPETTRRYIASNNRSRLRDYQRTMSQPQRLAG